MKSRMNNLIATGYKNIAAIARTPLPLMTQRNTARQLQLPVYIKVEFVALSNAYSVFSGGCAG
jgi:hypothetical protein